MTYTAKPVTNVTNLVKHTTLLTYLVSLYFHPKSRFPFVMLYSRGILALRREKT